MVKHTGLSRTRLAVNYGRPMYDDLPEIELELNAIWLRLLVMGAGLETMNLQGKR